MGELGLGGIDAIALAKGEKEKEGAWDKVFIPHRKNPVLFTPGAPLLSLLQRIRDESHRFALHYHHLLKRRQEFHSVLDEIPGVGRVMRKRLLTHFGSLQGVRDAAVDEIASLPGMTLAKAEVISHYLKAGDT